MPRRTLRTQLTLLYAGPFFISGIALLIFPVLQSSDSAPVSDQGVKLFGVAGPGSPPDTGFHQVLIASALGLLVMVLVSFVLGWLIAGRFLRPLRTITSTARDISVSNLHQRLDLKGRDDEFKELGETLDDLFERLEASFESQRHFVANASHELRTPLTAERSLLQVALADPQATEQTLRSTCQEVLALGEQQERLIEALLTLASSERGVEQRDRFDLAELAGNVVLVRSREAERRGIQIVTTLGTATAAGDPSLVESLVVNLVDNAIRHNLAGGRIEVVTGVRAGRAHVSVANTGTVIPPDQVGRLLQPFQRLGGERIRQAGGQGYGHGLGLAIVAAISRAHGATLTAEALPQGGLEIDVSFP
jgi:signal transduction histidine kinase